MFDLENYSGFIMAIVAFQIIPGAGTVAILNATARNGTVGGINAVFGTLTGDFIYMLASVLGLAAVLNAYPGVLTCAQWIGVGYLCWLGWKLLRASVSDQPLDLAFKRKGGACYRKALAVSLSNPKVMMFFLAFFPQFLHEGSMPPTLFILMVHVSVISFLYQTGLVLAGRAVAGRISKWPYARVVASRLAGMAFIGFGVKVALDSR